MGPAKVGPILGDMGPSAMINNIMDGSSRHAEFVSQFGDRPPFTKIHMPNENDILVSKKLRSLHAFRAMVSFLFNHIVHIVLMIPEKQMRRINATAIVTFMQTKHILRNFSYEKFVRKSMGHFRLSRFIGSVSNGKPPIPIMCNGAYPNPTTWFFVNKCHKTFFNWLAWTHSHGEVI